jgi:hypothetical protein
VAFPHLPHALNPLPHLPRLISRCSHSNVPCLGRLFPCILKFLLQLPLLGRRGWPWIFVSATSPIGTLCEAKFLRTVPSSNAASRAHRSQIIGSCQCCQMNTIHLKLLSLRALRKSQPTYSTSGASLSRPGDRISLSPPPFHTHSVSVLMPQAQPAYCVMLLQTHPADCSNSTPHHSLAISGNAMPCPTQAS